MPFSDHLIIYLYSYVPAVMLGAFFWWMDRFEREPILLVVAAFLWGAFGAGLLSEFWNTLFSVALEIYRHNNEANDALTAVIVAPLVEELTKGVFIFVMLKWHRVDNITDGILLGIVVGLGFAASENVFYAEEVYLSSGELAMWNNLWFREIHTTLLHASATAVWGAMLGHTRVLRGFARTFAVFNGYVLAVVTHGFWNFMATYAGSFGSRFNLIDLVMRLELVFIFGMLMTLFLVSVARESRVIIAELLEESANGIIPEDHIGFFASMVRLPGKHMLPKKILYHDYARLGVRLAFRKNEYRANPTRELLAEIQKLRSQLQAASEYEGEKLTLRYGQ